MMAVHERLHQQPLVTVGDVEDGGHLVHPAAQRLLAENVLAGLERAQRPGDVLVVGQRDVDRLDIGVGEKRVVGAVCAFDLPLAGVLARPFLVAAGDGDEVDQRRGLGGRDHEPVDAGRRDDAELDGLYPHDGSVIGLSAVSRIRRLRGRVRMKRTTSATSSADIIPGSASGVRP